MREIKFKAWDKKTKQMIEAGSLFNLTIYSGEVSAGFHLDNEEGTIIEGDFELMQFTGLKDKNGVEVFEGDIVEIDGLEGKETGEVVFEPTAGYLVIKSKDENYSTRAVAFGNGSLRGGKFTKVLGNIYENPKLLK